MMRRLQIGLTVAGVALFAALVRAIGVAPITTAFQRLGARFAVVVALELVLDGCNTRGWQWALGPAPLGFWRLYWIRQAGTAINQLTPTASVGGELAKALLLRGKARSSEILASLVVAKVSLAAAQATTVLLGLAVALDRLRDAPELARAIVTVFALIVAAIVAFVAVQRRGGLGRVAVAVAAIAPRSRIARAFRERAGALDERLRHLYRDRPGLIVAAVAWHVAGQLVGVVQLWFILGALGVPSSLATCLALEAASLTIDAATFFVPARVGVQEGGRVLIFTAFGLGAATGLAVAVVVRVNQLVVSAIGLAAFAYFSFSRTALAGSASET